MTSRPYAVAALLAALSATATSCTKSSSQVAPRNGSAGSTTAPAHAPALLPGPKPGAPAPGIAALVGEYDCNASICLVIEEQGSLWLLDTAKAAPKRTPLAMPAGSVRSARAGDAAGAVTPVFATDASGAAWPVRVGDMALRHRQVGPQAGSSQLQVMPVRPLAELRVEALAATPPPEPAPAHAAELVELTTLDPTIRLEIRYATTNNFLGTRFYDEARAFMQRPAAEAVVRANAKLRALGYGLLIHDAYRPWYVTKMFWDATPVDTRWLVANPASGSKHNRGAAVDLTLFELSTGHVVEMPSTYDESTGRAYADYPGGTALQRWHRALLRNAMVAEGFLVNPSEWWHFDYRNWRDYAIGNVAFDRIPK